MSLFVVALAPAAAIIGMIVAVVLHLLATWADAILIRAYAASLFGGMAASLGIVFVLAPPGQGFWLGLAAFALFGSWWFVFLIFLQCAESSLRVRLLQELEAANGSIPRAELMRRYNDDIIIRVRLQRLADGGAVMEREGRLHMVSPTLLRWARSVRFLKVVLFGHPSEFDWTLARRVEDR